MLPENTLSLALHNQTSLELIEMIEWIAVGFIPTTTALEVKPRKLAIEHHQGF